MSLINDVIDFLCFEDALIYRSSDDCELALIENTDKNYFDEICDKLVINGFSFLI